ncbi:hypothetical protein AcW1_006937 [Taiwanofungus camphoratus]|nr:hypothetical protein AcW1_006937 [Antrodia cinnamomea]
MSLPCSFFYRARRHSRAEQQKNDCSLDWPEEWAAVLEDRSHELVRAFLLMRSHWLFGKDNATERACIPTVDGVLSTCAMLHFIRCAWCSVIFSWPSQPASSNVVPKLRHTLFQWSRLSFCILTSAV